MEFPVSGSFPSPYNCRRRLDSYILPRSAPARNLTVPALTPMTDLIAGRYELSARISYCIYGG